MSRLVSVMATALLALCAAVAPLGAQNARQTATLEQPTAQREALELKESRYQIGQMERVLEGAVEHGARVTRDRLQAVLPAEMLLSEKARVRGFRLDGYGVFFDVVVPPLEGTLPWIFRTLDQNDLGLGRALKALRSHIEAAGDANLQQALKRVELQVAPTTMAAASASAAEPVSVGARVATGSGATRPANTAPNTAADPILGNPEEAYRAEVKDALMDAMLEHNRGLGIRADEWLTIAARRNEDRPPLAVADTDARTIVIRVRGADLTAFLAGQVSREDARKRMEVRVF